MKDRLFLIFILLSGACVVHANDTPPLTPSEKFNADIIKKSQHSPTTNAPLPNPTNNPYVKEFGAVISATKWPDNKIYVCWENPAPSNSAARQWTRDAVQGSWGKESTLLFTGWEKCATTNAGIRIKIEDTGPHVKTLGKLLNKVPDGMVLNFTFNNWGQNCKQKLEYCIRTIAVHEFGHAIGFTHEQNRPDVPGECADKAQGSDPDEMLTSYDKDSVMNYCNEKWSNGGVLSQLDIESLHVFYEPK